MSLENIYIYNQNPITNVYLLKHTKPSTPSKATITNVSSLLNTNNTLPQSLLPLLTAPTVALLWFMAPRVVPLTHFMIFT